MDRPSTSEVKSLKKYLYYTLKIIHGNVHSCISVLKYKRVYLQYRRWLYNTCVHTIYNTLLLHYKYTRVQVSGPGVDLENRNACPMLPGA